MFYLGKDPQTQMYCHALGLLNIILNYVGMLPRFLLMLHYSAHRSAFREDWLNAINGWVLAPLYGVPCGLYYLHHCVMHHIENNHGMDLSATDAFQRDSLTHFLFYWFRFTFGIWIEIPYYCIKSKRYQWLPKVACGISIWLTAILLTSIFSSVVAIWVFIVPFFTSFLPMSLGNWGQHIFVDPDNCRSNFALTYNCIDSPYNQLAFNDGYHIIHHANARLHWSEMPKQFHDTLEKHQKEGALTFRYLDFFLVAVMVMSGQLRKLAADYYIHLGDKESAPTVDEMEAKFRRWLLPFNPDKLPADPNVGKKTEG
jgi:fatty acid desaturase